MNNSLKAFEKGYRINTRGEVYNKNTRNIRRLQFLNKKKPQFSFWYKTKVLNCYLSDLINLTKEKK